MGASLGSHDTGDDYRLGYMVTHMRSLRIESMQLRIPSCTATVDSLTVLLTQSVFPVCLLRFPHLASVAIRGDSARRIL